MDLEETYTKEEVQEEELAIEHPMKSLIKEDLLNQRDTSTSLTFQKSFAISFFVLSILTFIVGGGIVELNDEESTSESKGFLYFAYVMFAIAAIMFFYNLYFIVKWKSMWLTTREKITYARDVEEVTPFGLEKAGFEISDEAHKTMIELNKLIYDE
jgi:hypothetical protein